MMKLSKKGNNIDELVTVFCLTISVSIEASIQGMGCRKSSRQIVGQVTDS